MESKLRNILIGSIAALLCASILIYAIESQRSLSQIFLGFIIFVFPFALLSAFFSKTGSFLLVFVSVMTGYTVTTYSYNDFWLGILLAAIIGGAVFLYVTIPSVKTMNDYKPFSAEDYKEKAKEFQEKNKS
jgi:L-lactate permease